MKTNENTAGQGFKYTEGDSSLFRNSPKFNIDDMYERAFSELGLQQAKRDQLITIYLAAFAFILPPLLSAENGNWTINAWIFMGLGVIGFLFALIIIRYRVYKEVYWHCCRTLNVLMDVDEDKRSKETIQNIFYSCMYKKIKSSIGENGKFKKFIFFRKNIFSSETLYLLIHAIIAGSIFGFGVGILVPAELYLKVLIGCLCGAAMLLIIMALYFKELKKVYMVCIDKTDKSFNDVYKNAWLLHFFI